ASSAACISEGCSDVVPAEGSKDMPSERADAQSWESLAGALHSTSSRRADASASTGSPAGCTGSYSRWTSRSGGAHSDASSSDQPIPVGLLSDEWEEEV